MCPLPLFFFFPLCPLPLKPPSPSHPSELSQNTSFGVPLSYSKFSLAIYCTYISMLQCYSLKSSHLLSPQLCPEVCSLSLHLHCCPVGMLISTIFLDSIYMHYYMIFVFLTYFTLYNRL